MLIHRIVRNQVYINKLASRLHQFCQLQSVLNAVVDIPEQDVFHSHAASGDRQIIINGFHQLFDRNRFIDFHYARPQFVIGSMKRYRQIYA
ncbi:hypothetical protein D3C78_1525800 [compost metagenome]